MGGRGYWGLLVQISRAGLVSEHSGGAQAVGRRAHWRPPGRRCSGSSRAEQGLSTRAVPQAGGGSSSWRSGKSGSDGVAPPAPELGRRAVGFRAGCWGRRGAQDMAPERATGGADKPRQGAKKSARQETGGVEKWAHRRLKKNAGGWFQKAAGTRLPAASGLVHQHLDGRGVAGLGARTVGQHCCAALLPHVPCHRAHRLRCKSAAGGAGRSARVAAQGSGGGGGQHAARQWRQRWQEWRRAAACLVRVGHDRVQRHVVEVSCNQKHDRSAAGKVRGDRMGRQAAAEQAGHQHQHACAPVSFSWRQRTAKGLLDLHGGLLHADHAVANYSAQQQRVPAAAVAQAAGGSAWRPGNAGIRAGAAAAWGRAQGRAAGWRTEQPCVTAASGLAAAPVEEDHVDPGNGCQPQHHEGAQVRNVGEGDGRVEDGATGGRGRWGGAGRRPARAAVK